MGSSKRNKSSKRRSARKGSMVGRLMLEAVAVVGFLMLLAVSNTESTNDNAVVEVVADRTADYGSLVTGFVSDQLERNQMFARR